tara:strand:- start:669 stop:878 length:210 start_codon:yes stop_codon:yes gene_type:complete
MTVIPNEKEATQAFMFAENLATAYKARGGKLNELLAAFVEVVYARDRRVGHDCLIALDRFVGDEKEGEV